MHYKNIIGGIALVSGTCIGAGMLAIPVSTHNLGFLNTSIIFIACWFFMSISAMYLLEANLQFEEENINLLSMADKSLGTFGKFLAWTAYLILLYALTAAYLTGSSAWFIDKIEYLTGYIPSIFSVSLTIAAILSIAAFTGTKGLDYLNRVFVIGLTICILVTYFICLPEAKITLLFSEESKFSISTLPLIITSFGFHIVIPSLVIYYSKNIKNLKLTVLIGSFIPLIVYILWEAAILGVIPSVGVDSLATISESGKPTVGITKSLSTFLDNNIISYIVSGLSIFAVITSIIGVTMSLFDFLADGFGMQKHNINEYLKLVAIVFIPPIFFVVNYPQGFIYALSFAGIFVAVLLGILPILMVWANRYIHKLDNTYQVAGGKFLLATSFLFFAFVIIVEVCNELGVTLI